MATRTSTPFELHLEAAATPPRVVAAASYLSRVLEAAGTDPDDDNVTMEVSNLNMKAAIHPRTPSGRKAADSILSFLKNPVAVAQKHPATREIAAALADRTEELTLHRATLVQPRCKEPLAVLDDEFAKIMKDIAGFRQNIDLRGITAVYSVVYRIGRTSDKGAFKVRLLIDGRPQEIPMSQDNEDAFFDAFRLRKPVKISIQAAWYRDHDRALRINPERSKALRVETWEPISGKEFLEQAKAAESGLFGDDLEDILADSEGT